MTGAVPFTYAAGESHAALTFYALTVATHLEEPFRALLLLLADCVTVGVGDPADEDRLGQLPLQLRGASYRSLAAVADLAGLEDEEERVRWLRIAESVPLSEAHTSHILNRLEERRAA